MAGDRPSVPDTALFRFWTSFRIRYADIDTLGHLNNVAMMVLLETARVEYLVKVGSTDPMKPNLVMASISCDYLAPAFFGQEVRVGVRLTRFGRTSYELEYLVVREDDVPVAVGHSVLVNTEPGETAPVPLGEEFRRSVRAFEAGDG